MGASGRLEGLGVVLLGGAAVAAAAVEARAGRGRGLVLAGELLEGLALGLGDEEGGEAADQHEERVDLQHVVHPVVGAAVVVLERRDRPLPDDRPDLAARRRDAMRRRPVPRREHLPGHDERRHLFRIVSQCEPTSIDLRRGEGWQRTLGPKLKKNWAST